jgi:hypothetical protein
METKKEGATQVGLRLQLAGRCLLAKAFCTIVQSY